MDSNIHFFTVWTHRSAKSIFGADSHPVIRNGELLCFPSEEHAQAECDRLNAASGGSHVHYSVKPAHIRPVLANDLHLLAEAFRRVSGKRISAPPSPNIVLQGRRRRRNLGSFSRRDDDHIALVDLARPGRWRNRVALAF